MKATGMLVVPLRGVILQILVSLKVFRTKIQYFYAHRYRLGYDHERETKDLRQCF